MEIPEGVLAKVHQAEQARNSTLLVASQFCAGRCDFVTRPDYDSPLPELHRGPTPS